MPKDLRLVEFNEDSFSISSAGMVTGELWIEFAGFAFPEKRWNDFVVVVLSWWCEALNGLLVSSTNAVLRFMDGPYEVRISLADSERIHLRCAEGRKREVVFESIAAIKDLRVSLVRASKAVLSFCDNQKITNSDIEFLRREFRILNDV